MRRKQNFEISFWVWKWHSSVNFYFSRLLFSFAGHLVGFIFVGKVFRKAFRILGLGERKGRPVVKQHFHGNYQANVTRFFAFLSSVLEWIELILVRFERPLHSAQVSTQRCPWPLKLMTSQVVEGMCIRTGGYGGSGVNGLMSFKHL